MNMLSLHDIKAVRISQVRTHNLNIGCQFDGRPFSVQDIDIEGDDGIILKIQLFMKAGNQSPVIEEAR